MSESLTKWCSLDCWSNLCLLPSPENISHQWTGLSDIWLKGCEWCVGALPAHNWGVQHQLIGTSQGWGKEPQGGLPRVDKKQPFCNGIQHKSLSPSHEDYLQIVSRDLLGPLEAFLAVSGTVAGFESWSLPPVLHFPSLPRMGPW